MLTCAGIADPLLQNLIQSDVHRDVRIAEKICAHVKIAASSFPAQEAIAAKQALKDRAIKNAQTSATGFHWTKNTEVKARGRKKTKRKPALQERHLMIYLNNYDKAHCIH